MSSTETRISSLRSRQLALLSRVPEPRVRAALHNSPEKDPMEELTSSSVTRNRDLVRASAAALLAAASRRAPC